MNTRKSSNENKFKNGNEKRDDINLKQLTKTKNTRSKNINFNKIYQLDHKNIKMNDIQEDQIIIIDKQDYIKGINIEMQSNYQQSQHFIKKTRQKISRNGDERVQQNEVSQDNDKTLILRSNQTKGKRGRKMDQKNKKIEFPPTKQSTYFIVDDSQQIYQQQSSLNKQMAQKQKIDFNRSKRKYVQEQMKFSQCIFAQQLKQKVQSPMKKDELSLLSRIDNDKGQFERMQYSIQQDNHQYSVIDNRQDSQSFQKLEIKKSILSQFFDKVNTNEPLLNQKIISTPSFQQDNQHNEAQLFERNPSKKIKIDQNSIQQHENLQYQTSQMNNQLSTINLIYKNQKSSQFPQNKDNKQFKGTSVMQNKQITNEDIIININNQQSMDTMQNKKKFTKQQLFTLINQQPFKLSELLNPVDIQQGQIKESSINQIKKNKESLKNKGFYSTCNQCKLNKQYNYLLSQLFNQLLDDDIQLNFDQIFLQQETLSILSCLSPNQLIYQSGKVHYNIEKIADISDNKTICSMIVQRQVNDESQIEDILNKFKLAKIVKIKQEWICILRVKQMNMSKQEHFKYIPARILAKWHREVVKTFLYR